ncbi:DUF1127 domain-containing protein [Reinekea marinisedimentorum]|uniref:Uncharacterized protein DUF1127 n=1 Tax=Reinekea marinisedimentorum TaxID=230495 RepID=A0A4R3HSI7_9GAMM|nr:DUF1127 domain-containing protein [Reinekea marinisedimentorum]TCS35908.1 uncharacterized protein DUF1127 [Reinekea marinisedimentorum]
MTTYQLKQSFSTMYVGFPRAISFTKWLRNYKTRQSLAGLSDHMLKDVGIGKTQAKAEIAKPFWKD